MNADKVKKKLIKHPTLAKTVMATHTHTHTHTHLETTHEVPREASLASLSISLMLRGATRSKAERNRDVLG